MLHFSRIGNSEQNCTFYIRNEHERTSRNLLCLIFCANKLNDKIIIIRSITGCPAAIQQNMKKTKFDEISTMIFPKGFPGEHEYADAFNFPVFILFRRPISVDYSVCGSYGSEYFYLD